MPCSINSNYQYILEVETKRSNLAKCTVASMYHAVSKIHATNAELLSVVHKTFSQPEKFTRIWTSGSGTGDLYYFKPHQ